MPLIAAAALVAGSLAVAPSPEPPSVLVFTKTAGFRHDAIPDAVAAVRRLGEENGFLVEVTDDSDAFTDERLARHAAVVFLLTTGDVLEPSRQASLQRYVRAGGGFVGVHSAADTEHGWPWYLGLVGAEFRSHPAPQTAVVRVNDRVHPSTRALPEAWTRQDEWYDFTANPRSDVHVLATVDESTYTGGAMGGDHPVAWCRFYDGGRTWYTAMGHTRESWADPRFVGHVLGGLTFAAGWPDCGPRGVREVAPRDVGPRAGAPRP